MMMIICYFTGVGLGLIVLILIRKKRVEQYYGPLKLPLCITLCYHAALDVYFYRVWLVYYKYKLQNEFEKVRKSPVELNQSTILSHILALTKNLGTNMWNIEESKQTEKLIKSPRRFSVRKSSFVRYRWLLGRSIVIKAFYFFVWICESAIAVWNYFDDLAESEVLWSPKKFPGECFILIKQVVCFVVLFLYPSDDIFLIKKELRLIYLIITVEIVLYCTLLYCIGEIPAYLSLCVSEFCIMVAITFSNYKALTFKFSSFLGPMCEDGRSFYDLHENSGDKLTMANILGSESLFQAFERHLKKEFSLEHLNFIVAIVYYKRLCADRKRNPQKQKITLRDCLKSREISMQPVCFTDSKTSENALNVSTAVTQTAGIASGGFESELSMIPKFPSKLTRQKKGNRWISKLGPMLYWIKSDIEVSSDMEDTAFFIFNEYCDRGAPQEINISKRERKELFEFFSSSLIDPAELYTIFDPAFDSVMDLLENDSLRRFRRNSSCNKFVKW